MLPMLPHTSSYLYEEGALGFYYPSPDYLLHFLLNYSAKVVVTL